MRHSREYLDYLKSDQWARIRRAMLARCNYECQDCGRTADLEVHHLHYNTLGYERPTDLAVLCPTCHERADKLREEQVARDSWSRRLDGWASKRYGEQWEDYCDPERVEEEFEEWLDRRGDDSY